MILTTNCRQCREPLELWLPDDIGETDAAGIAGRVLCAPCALAGTLARRHCGGNDAAPVLLGRLLGAIAPRGAGASRKSRFPAGGWPGAVDGESVLPIENHIYEKADTNHLDD